MFGWSCSHLQVFLFRLFLDLVKDILLGFIRTLILHFSRSTLNVSTENLILAILNFIFLHRKKKHKSIIIKIVYIYYFRVLFVIYGLREYLVWGSGARHFGAISYFFFDFLEDLLLIRRIKLSDKSRSSSDWFELKACSRRSPSSSSTAHSIPLPQRHLLWNLRRNFLRTLLDKLFQFLFYLHGDIPLQLAIILEHTFRPQNNIEILPNLHMLTLFLLVRWRNQCQWPRIELLLRMFSLVHEAVGINYSGFEDLLLFTDHGNFWATAALFWKVL